MEKRKMMSQCTLNVIFNRWCLNGLQVDHDAPIWLALKDKVLVYNDVERQSSTYQQPTLVYPPSSGLFCYLFTSSSSSIMHGSDDLNNTTSKISTIRDLLQQLAQDIQTSTNAEETEEDLTATFWATYKKVADAYDDNMVERCHANMDMVLVVAALCSAINATFIATMLPSPADKTNALLSQLVQISLQGSSAVQLTPSTIDSSSDPLTQALASASLLFSLLAASGAVLGKQWLSYYMKNRYIRGTLEGRCKQRHRKFQKLQTWRLESVLQSFVVLLYISLFQFILFLIVAAWAQQRSISIVVAVGVAFCMLYYIPITLISAVFPDCPFQTSISLTIRDILHRFCRYTRSYDPHHERQEASTVSAVEWMLELSTDPDALRTISMFMMTNADWTHSVHWPGLCGRMLDKFKECFGTITLKHDALEYGKALVHIYLNDSGCSSRQVLHHGIHNWTGWKSWRDLYLPWALEDCRISHDKMLKSDNADLQKQYQADTRTALRKVVATGINGFIDPDNENLVRDDHYSDQLGSYLPDVDVDWLIVCAERFCDVNDFVAARYPLLLLSGALKKSSFPIQHQRLTPILNKSLSNRYLRIITLRVACALDYKDWLWDDSFSQAVLAAICFPPINSNRDNYDSDFTSTVIDLLNLPKWPKGSDLEFCTLHDIQLLAFLVLPEPKVDHAKYTPYCQALIRYMDSRQPDYIRHTAPRKAYNTRQYLPVSLHPEFSSALALLCPVGEQSSDTDQDFYSCVRLIFALAKRPDWQPYLEEDAHIQRYIEMVQKLIPGSSDGFDKPSPCHFYLVAGIILRIQVFSSHTAAIPPNQWWNLLKMAWRVAGDAYDRSSPSYVSDVLDDEVEILEPLATETAKCMPHDASIQDLEFLLKWLTKTVDKLGSHRSNVDQGIVSAVEGLMGVVRSRLEAAR
ncbi:hypothetical protein AZE42_02076 [Rhizopogon vesiculosus]|uniref:DUF6535 domain-containing protein n=1 Tax=Rhizopogon vesiculosus TaxID=180088 RepID=A0A1J8PG92_9AGAM|nr:hypothetical protein AZE42_02076 [Rhizopogon vesiculosus]